MTTPIDTGPGYRLLADDEIIKDGDERMGGCDREPRKWFRVALGIGITVTEYKSEYRSIGILAVRRPITAVAPEIDQLRAEVRNLREQLDKARFEIVSLSIDKRSLQDDLDAASAALRDLGCAQGEIDDDIAQCIHDLATRWRTGMTEQRACEIVNQMRRDGRLDVSDESCGWFTPVGPENWQCRPAQPKPVTITVTCPPDKREAVAAAIRAAGGSV